LKSQITNPVGTKNLPIKPPVNPSFLIKEPIIMSKEGINNEKKEILRLGIKRRRNLNLIPKKF